VHFYLEKGLLILLPRDARSAKRGIAIVSCLSVCPSVTLRYRGHMGWTSSKLIKQVFAPQSHNIGNLFPVMLVLGLGLGPLLKAKILVLGLGIGLVAQVLGLGLGLGIQVLGLGLESGPWPWPWPRLRSVGRGQMQCSWCGYVL